MEVRERDDRLLGVTDLFRCQLGAWTVAAEGLIMIRLQTDLPSTASASTAPRCHYVVTMMSQKQVQRRIRLQIIHMTMLHTNTMWWNVCHSLSKGLCGRSMRDAIMA